MIIFTARRYASAVYVVVVCLSVRLSDTSQRWLNRGSHKKRQPIDYSFLVPIISAKFQRDHPQRGRQIEVG